jgi:hypothetical protein
MIALRSGRGGVLPSTAGKAERARITCTDPAGLPRAYRRRSFDPYLGSRQAESLAPVQGRPISRVRSGAVDRLGRGAKQLGRLPDHIRGLVFEAIHQKAVAAIVVVEDPPQVLPGRQAPVPLQLGRNRSAVKQRPKVWQMAKTSDLVAQPGHVFGLMRDVSYRFFGAGSGFSWWRRHVAFLAGRTTAAAPRDHARLYPASSFWTG